MSWGREVCVFIIRSFLHNLSWKRLETLDQFLSVILSFLNQFFLRRRTSFWYNTVRDNDWIVEVTGLIVGTPVVNLRTTFKDRSFVVIPGARDS